MIGVEAHAVEQPNKSIDVQNISSRRLWELLSREETKARLENRLLISNIRQELRHRGELNERSRWRPPH